MKTEKQIQYEAAAKAKKAADADYDKAKKELKKDIRLAQAKLHAADRARAATRQNYRLARKAMLDEKDSIAIQKAGV